MKKQLADLGFLFWSKVIEVKLLGFMLLNQVVSTPFKKKDGTYGTREEYGSVFIQVPKGLCTARIFESDGSGSFRTSELDLSEVDIDFTVNKQYGGKKAKGTGILRLPIKGWDGGKLFVESPTYKNKEGKYKATIWPKNAYDRHIMPNIGQGCVDAFLAVMGEYGVYAEPPVVTYNGTVLKNGCHSCKYAVRFSVDEKGEIPNIGLPDMKDYEVSKIHNCYCSLMDHPVLGEAFDLINESMFHDKEEVSLRDKDDNEYFTTSGQGRVKYGNRVLSWSQLLTEVGSSECCPHYAFSGMTNSGSWYSGSLSPSTILHIEDKAWTVGKPEVGYEGRIGFLAGNHVLVTVDSPAYTQMISEGKVQTLVHEEKVIVRPVVEDDLYIEYKKVVLTCLADLVDLYGEDAYGVFQAFTCGEEDVPDLLLVPKELRGRFFEEVALLLGIDNIELLDACWDVVESYERELHV